ncbi:MAG: FISUMP domain-containing protein [Candidatus Falkowbacteria bacterium]
MNPKKAFTLLEILLVVAAIAILAGIVILAINPSRQLAKTRNTQRSMDVNTIQKALYQYSIDHNSLSGVVSTTPTEICRSGASSCSGLIDLSFLTNNSVYLTSLPTDPQVVSSNGTGYMVYILPSGRPAVSSSLAELDQEISTINKSFICGSALIDTRDSQSYSTVQIGDQCWFKENLRAVKYNDNTNILNLTDSTQWQNDTSGAYVWVQNNYAVYGATYGALYNFYAVNSGKLCPSGWHIPSDAEFVILTNFLSVDGQGGAGINVGGKLKDVGITYWTSPNIGATNSSGFTALPAGYRNASGAFAYRGYYSYFWSSSPDGPNAWNRYFHYNYLTFFRASYSQATGFSVRCLLD